MKCAVCGTPLKRGEYAWDSRWPMSVFCPSHAPGPRGSSGHEFAENPDGLGADEKKAEV